MMILMIITNTFINTTALIVYACLSDNRNERFGVLAIRAYHHKIQMTNNYIYNNHVSILVSIIIMTVTRYHITESYSCSIDSRYHINRKSSLGGGWNRVNTHRLSYSLQAVDGGGKCGQTQLDFTDYGHRHNSRIGDAKYNILFDE